MCRRAIRVKIASAGMPGDTIFPARTLHDSEMMVIMVSRHVVGFNIVADQCMFVWAQSAKIKCASVDLRVA